MTNIRSLFFFLRLCFDCGGSSTYASITFGMFVCEKCAVQHRALGTGYSLVKEVADKGWKERQLNFLILGGNHKLRLFFEKYRYVPG